MKYKCWNKLSYHKPIFKTKDNSTMDINLLNNNKWVALFYHSWLTTSTTTTTIIIMLYMYIVQTRQLSFLSPTQCNKQSTTVGLAPSGKLHVTLRVYMHNNWWWQDTFINNYLYYCTRLKSRIWRKNLICWCSVLKYSVAPILGCLRVGVIGGWGEGGECLFSTFTFLWANVEIIKWR